MATFKKYYILEYIKHDHGRKAVKAAGNVERGRSCQELGGKGEGGKEVRERTCVKSGLRLRKSLVFFQAFVSGTAKKPLGMQGRVPARQVTTFKFHHGTGSQWASEPWCLPFLSWVHRKGDILACLHKS